MQGGGLILPRIQSGFSKKNLTFATDVKFGKMSAERLSGVNRKALDQKREGTCLKCELEFRKETCWS